MKKLIILLITVSLTSCGSDVSIPDFDNKIWKNDKSGCKSERVKQIDNLFNHRHLLKGVSEDNMIGFLGMPDQQDLQTRGQKMYKYWISGSTKCPKTGTGKKLVIRFNAINKANEVFIE